LKSEQCFKQIKKLHLDGHGYMQCSWVGFKFIDVNNVPYYNRVEKGVGKETIHLLVQSWKHVPCWNKIKFAQFVFLANLSKKYAPKHVSFNSFLVFCCLWQRWVSPYSISWRFFLLRTDLFFPLQGILHPTMGSLTNLFGDHQKLGRAQVEKVVFSGWIR
jgi:hypothetical protein